MGADHMQTPWPFFLGLFGVFVPPVGVIHGWMIWLGMT
jgi:hypothetical protein